MRFRPLLLSVVAAALATLGPGCGSSSGSSEQKVGPFEPKVEWVHLTCDPLVPTQPADARDEAILRAALAAHLPGGDGPLAEMATCRYTMTADGDFIIDRLPQARQIIVASPCSGHGFKFSPVIGEILADLATTGDTRHDISRFSFDRFG